MSLEFCKAGIYKSELNLAKRQEEQLSYLVTSELQASELSTEYLKAWAERKYQTNDHFLNFIKSVFREKNFLLFAKFMRKPLPSAKLVNAKIKPQLKRVFNAEDADSKYSVSGVDNSDFLPLLEVDDFNQQLFEAYFNAHNSIVICELDSEEANTPFRYILGIEKVRSIKPDRKGNIEKISFYSTLEINEKHEKGTIFIDDEKYAFYPNDERVPHVEALHDLGYCPAHFISPRKYGSNWVVRESLLTYIREELEEYNFLKTIQKMSEPDSSIATVVQLDAGENVKKQEINKPEIDGLIGGQQPELYATNPPTNSGILAAGTIHKIPPSVKDDGAFDMDIVKNYISFHFTPIEPLEFMNKRIKEIENSIISTLIGDIVNSNEESKNMLQIEKSITVLDNTLTDFGSMLNRIRTLSDTDMLSLRYGKDRVKDVFITFGTDFMIDSQTLLFDSLAKAPNVIERKNILKRINLNRYKNNQSQLLRNNLLYDLLPFISDADFEKGKASGIVSDINLKLQIRFSYWISKFEAMYGDIVTFYQEQDLSNDEKLIFINNILIELIKEEDSQTQIKDESNTLTNQQGGISDSGDGASLRAVSSEIDRGEGLQ